MKEFRKRFRPMRLVHRHFNERPRVRRWLTGLLFGRRDRDVALFMHNIRINSTLENGYYRASRLSRTNNTLARESLMLQRIALFYGDGVTLIDIGANIGLFSICAAMVRNVYPDFRIMAFEPNPDTFTRLRANAEKFGFDAIECALGSEEGEADFVGGAVSGVTTRVDHANAYNIATTGFRVRTLRLDGFDLPGDLVLKIDVEGQERDVLDGASGLFDGGRVKAVFIDGFDHEAGIPEWLLERGFRLLEPHTLRPFDVKYRGLLAIRD